MPSILGSEHLEGKPTLSLRNRSWWAVQLSFLSLYDPLRAFMATFFWLVLFLWYYIFCSCAARSLSFPDPLESSWPETCQFTQNFSSCWVDMNEISAKTARYEICNSSTACQERKAVHDVTTKSYEMLEPFYSGWGRSSLALFWVVCTWNNSAF